MRRPLVAMLLALAACQSVPESQKVTYRAVSREQNAAAIAAIVNCLRQRGCEALLGERLECGPFLWRDLLVPDLTNVTTYTLPLTARQIGSVDVKCEGRRGQSREEVWALWRAFGEHVPLKSLQRIRSLNDMECRIYTALVPGEIREPVFIVVGGGHKILMQLSDGKLSYIDDFRNIVIRD